MSGSPARENGIHIDVVIDDELMAEALESTGLKTEAEVKEEARRTLVCLRRQERARALRGELEWEGELEVAGDHGAEDEEAAGFSSTGAFLEPIPQQVGNQPCQQEC